MKEYLKADIIGVRTTVSYKKYLSKLAKKSKYKTLSLFMEELAKKHFPEPKKYEKVDNE